MNDSTVIEIFLDDHAKFTKAKLKYSYQLGRQLGHAEFFSEIVKGNPQALACLQEEGVKP
jgi:hypothetical protein